MEKDDVFFLKVGTKHQYKSDANNPWHKYWIVFDGDFAESLIRCYLPKDVYLFKNCNIKKYFSKNNKYQLMYLWKAFNGKFYFAVGAGFFPKGSEALMFLCNSNLHFRDRSGIVEGERMFF